MDFWRSQNISESENEFKLRKHKPLTWYDANDDATVNQYTQRLFDTARVPYVAFGPKHTPQALVFQVTRTGQSTLLSLIPAISHFPRTAEERKELCRFIFQTMQDVEGLGPKRHMRIRLVLRPIAVKLDIVMEFLNIALIFGWDIIAVDGNRKRESVNEVLNQIEEKKLEIENNFVVSRSDSLLPYDAPRVHDDDTSYWIAKRKLEIFMLENNIPEGESIMEVTQRDVERLLPLYTTWFGAMVQLYASRMPESLRRVLDKKENGENATALLRANVLNWGSFFIEFDTKYPLLVASIYLWRIEHWILLRDYS